MSNNVPTTVTNKSWVRPTDIEHTEMKLLDLITILLLAPATAIAQTDTLRIEPDTAKSPSALGTEVGGPSGKALVLDWDKQDGVVLDILNDGDSTSTQKPIVISTKHKVFRIYTTDRDSANAPIDVEQRLKEARTARRNMFTYWSGLDIGVNTLLGPDNDADLGVGAEFMTIDNARSRFLSINFMERKVPFGTHHMGLLTGLGLEFNNYHLKNNVLLAYTADSIYAVTLDSPELRKNKLRQIGLRVPLMLEFNTKRAPLPVMDEILAGKVKGYSTKGNFHLAAGVVGSWYFDTLYKQKFMLDGQRRKESDKGDHLLLPYRAAASVRVGYGSFNLIAEYALTPLFREGKGPELTPFNIGITLIGFN